MNLSNWLIYKTLQQAATMNNKFARFTDLLAKRTFTLSNAPITSTGTFNFTAKNPCFCAPTSS